MSKIVKLTDDDWDLTDVEKHSTVADWFEDGIRCVIKRNLAFCGYVGVPIDHPLAGFDYDDIPLDCHGGLTFSGELDGIAGWHFYGWDYAHAGDYIDFSKLAPGISFADEKKWTLGEVKHQVADVLWNFKCLAKLAEKLAQSNEKTRR